MSPDLGVHKKGQSSRRSKPDLFHAWQTWVFRPASGQVCSLSVARAGERAGWVILWPRSSTQGSDFALNSPV